MQEQIIQLQNQLQQLQQRFDELDTNALVDKEQNSQVIIRDIVFIDRDLVTGINNFVSIGAGGGSFTAPVPMTGWLKSEWRGNNILIPYKLQ